MVLLAYKLTMLLCLSLSPQICTSTICCGFFVIQLAYAKSDSESTKGHNVLLYQVACSTESESESTKRSFKRPMQQRIIFLQRVYICEQCQRDEGV